ncbi:YggT family protein [Sporosarcina beigongshangi]|uniref:YggT family protein n=1 Tax=Sporosarcina beigongshangi TaxID=2782538 RepID=UPI00193A0F6B|nr:YggT family protein [Sporosarcina beigongshangi]
MVVLLYNGVYWAFQIYTIALVIYILMSWVPSTRETKIGQFLAVIVEPYLSFFRKFIPPLGMIDISPIVALFALSLIRAGVISILNIVFF